MADVLGLSSDQRSKRAGIMKALVHSRATLFSELAQRRGEMVALWTTASPNVPSRTAVLQKQAQIDAVKVRIQQLNLDAEFAVLKLYTPDQAKKALSTATSPTQAAGCFDCCDSCHKGDCSFNCGPITSSDPPGSGDNGDNGCEKDGNSCNKTWCATACKFNDNTNHCDCQD